MARFQNRLDDAPVPVAGRRRVAQGHAYLLTFLALGVALLLAALPATASAGTSFPVSDNGKSISLPSDQSAGDQYVETLPTTKGPRVPGRGKHAKKLSRDLARKLASHGGSDAAALKSLATSPVFGTSADAGKGSTGKGSHKSRPRNGKRHGNSTPAVPSAAINAVDGGETGLGWLALAILTITALALGAVGYQRYRDKGSSTG
jgi:hypothetical protein